MKIIPVLYEKKEDCCSCTACYAVCPTHSISMVVDKEGFLYPQVDEKLCIRCYRCMRVCPIKIVDRESRNHVT